MYVSFIYGVQLCTVEWYDLICFSGYHKPLTTLKRDLIKGLGNHQMKFDGWMVG